MAYNSFTLNRVKQKFAIDNQTQAFLPKNIANLKPSQQLLNELADVEGAAIATEKAKSELIIMPVIKELKRNNQNKFSYFSGYKFNVDYKQGLTGYCDILFSAEPYKQEIEAPVFYIVEAKNDLLETGFGQCAAEMYAAQLFNQRNKIPYDIIYGCVSNAFTWCFLKLKNKQLLIDPSHIPLTLDKPDIILGVLQWVLEASLTPSK